MLLSELTQGLVSPDVVISGLSLDSRQVQPGNAFFSLAGTRTDGRMFIDEAIEAGAAAVICDSEHIASTALPVPSISVAGLKNRLADYAQRFYNLPADGCIGVTGTNGKTTIASIVQQMLAILGRPCGYSGTLGTSTSINGAMNFDNSESSLTTPDIFTLYAAIAKMAALGCRQVVIEASSHALDQNRLAGIPFDYAVFSNLSRDHFDYHGSFDQYFLAKKKLFAQCRKAVVNLDDRYGRQLLESLGNTPVIGFTCQPEQTARYRHIDLVLAEQITTSFDQVAFRLGYQNQTVQLRAGFTGSFAVSNLLAACAVLVDMGFGLGRLAEAASELVPPPGRLERVSEQPMVFIDYAHTPDALEQSLVELRSLISRAEGRLYVVFGCGGDRDAGKRPLMGAIAGRYADRIFVTDDNPRFESSQQIIDQVVAGIDPEHLHRLVVESDRKSAIRLAVESLTGDDCLLVAGKGHETGQIVGDQQFAFSDHEVVREAVQHLETAS